MVTTSRNYNECQQQLIQTLLESASDLENDVFLSVSNSVLELAKQDFKVVMHSVFSFLEQTRTSQGHMVRLLRILQQVIDCGNKGSGGSSVGVF